MASVLQQKNQYTKNSNMTLIFFEKKIALNVENKGI